MSPQGGQALPEIVGTMSGMTQYAPYPTELADLVKSCFYRPRWRVSLVDTLRDPAETHGEAAGGLTLVIRSENLDAYNHDRTIGVLHYFIVPAATYNRNSWRRWLFEQFLKVETHECMEFFAIEDDHPFAATHGPGDDPYVIHDFATETQRNMSFRGEVKA